MWGVLRYVPEPDAEEPDAEEPDAEEPGGVEPPPASRNGI
jgi:hypothetical protein